MDYEEQREPVPGERSPRALLAVRPEQPEAAVVHFDSRGEPCLPTGEALRVLLYPREVPENGAAQTMLSEQLRFLFPAGPLAEETAPEGEFVSGRRRYAYRIYRLASAPKGESDLAALLILERRGHRPAPTTASLARFGLSVREEQVVGRLLEGLSNKEIAESMGISPNTVKAFVRNILIKLEVSSRFGIVARLTGQTATRQRTRPRRTAALPMARLPVVRHL